MLATGYSSMSDWAAQLISPEVARKVGPWEGELRNMCKPTKQQGLWFFGGNLMQARHYSLYVGLQLKARMQK